MPPASDHATMEANAARLFPGTTVRARWDYASWRAACLRMFTEPWFAAVPMLQNLCRRCEVLASVAADYEDPVRGWAQRLLAETEGHLDRAARKEPAA